MKNLILVALFFSLVGVGWLLEREGKLNIQSGVEHSESLLNVEAKNVVEIHLPNVKIVRSDEGLQVLDVKYIASSEKFDTLVEKLNAIHSLKVLDVPEDKVREFFTHQDHFVLVKTFDEEIKLRLGDVSEVTGNFYLQKFKNGKQTLYLVKDTSFFEGFYKNEIEANLRRYLEFKELVASGPFDFVDNHIFLNLDPSALKSVKVDNKINRWFELRFDPLESQPVAPKGIRANYTKESISKMLDSIKFETFTQLDGNTLGNPLSAIEIETATGKAQAKVYGEMNGRKGLFATSSHHPKLVFILSDKGKNLFFESVQSFWDKRPELGVDLSKLDELEFSLGSQSENLQKFKVEDLKSFEIVPVGDKIELADVQYFNVIFNALFANNGFEQASYVNPLSASEAESREASLKKKVYLDIFGKTFVFSIEDTEMIVLDLVNHTELRYPVGVAVEELTQDRFFAFKGEQG